MKKKETSVIKLIEMDLDLLEPTSENKVPYGVKFKINADVEKKYRETFGEKWEVLIDAYHKSVMMANRFLVQELTRLCREGLDGETKKTEETKFS